MRIDRYTAGEYGSKVTVYRLQPDGPFFSEIGGRQKIIRIEGNRRITKAKFARQWANKRHLEVFCGVDPAERQGFEAQITPYCEPVAYNTLGPVYFVQCETTHRIKIGTSRDPARRLKDLQVGCPTRLRLVGYLDWESELTESRLHYDFSDYRLHGEWFEPVEEILELIRKSQEDEWTRNYCQPLIEPAAHPHPKEAARNE